MTIDRLHGTLRRYFSDNRLFVAGDTVADVLQGLCWLNPEFETVIFEGQSLRPHLRFIVRGRDIELMTGTNTPLSNTDELAIFEPISGGR